MDNINAYTLIIGASLIVILSYFYSLLSRKTNIPSVLMLLLTGVLLRQLLLFTRGKVVDLFPMLEILGIVGLIMIVLEAALDLDINREKKAIFFHSFFIALLSLLIKSFAISGVLMLWLHTDLLNSLIYAIPLSIMSSAIVIPSVGNIDKNRKEFMIYESTISDILGIMFFYLLLRGIEYGTVAQISVAIVGNILLTLLVSVVASYFLIYIFHKLKSDIRLFLLIAVLIMLYALGKSLHLSSLLIILAFGLILNNRWLIVNGRLRKYLNDEALTDVYKQLRLVTIESSFIVRTFFFVIFGMSIALTTIFNLNVLVISLVILVLLYGIRFILLRIFLKKRFMLQWLTAPRGLITVLLFYNIPDDFHVAEFESGIVLFIIIFSSILMALGMIKYGKDKKEIPPNTGIRTGNLDEHD